MEFDGGTPKKFGNHCFRNEEALIQICRSDVVKRVSSSIGRIDHLYLLLVQVVPVECANKRLMAGYPTPSGILPDIRGLVIFGLLTVD